MSFKSHDVELIVKTKDYNVLLPALTHYFETNVFKYIKYLMFYTYY